MKSQLIKKNHMNLFIICFTFFAINYLNAIDVKHSKGRNKESFFDYDQPLGLGIKIDIFGYVENRARYYDNNGNFIIDLNFFNFSRFHFFYRGNIIRSPITDTLLILDRLKYSPIKEVILEKNENDITNFLSIDLTITYLTRLVEYSDSVFFVKWETEFGKIIEKKYIGLKSLERVGTFFDESSQTFYFNGINYDGDKNLYSYDIVNNNLTVHSSLTLHNKIYIAGRINDNLIFHRLSPNRIISYNIKTKLIDLEIDIQHDSFGCRSIGVSSKSIYIIDEENNIVRIDTDKNYKQTILPVKGYLAVGVYKNDLYTFDKIDNITSFEPPLLKYNLDSLNIRQCLTCITRRPREVIIDDKHEKIAVYSYDGGHVSYITLFDYNFNYLGREWVFCNDEFLNNFHDYKYNLKFSNDGKMIAHSNYKKYLNIWDIENKNTLFLNTDEIVNDVVFKNNNTELIYGSDYGLIIKNIENKSEKKLLKTDYPIKKIFEIDSDNFYLVSSEPSTGTFLYKYKLSQNRILESERLNLLTMENNKIYITQNLEKLFSLDYVYDIKQKKLDFQGLSNLNLLSFDYSDKFNIYLTDNLRHKSTLKANKLENYDFDKKELVEFLDIYYDFDWHFSKSFRGRNVVNVKFIDKIESLMLIFEFGEMVILDISDLTKSSVPTEFILESNLRIVNQNGEFYIESDEDYIGSVTIFDYVGKKYGDYNLILKKGLNKIPDEFDYNFTKILVYKTANKTFLIK